MPSWKLERIAFLGGDRAIGEQDGERLEKMVRAHEGERQRDRVPVNADKWDPTQVRAFEWITPLLGGRVD